MRPKRGFKDRLKERAEEGNRDATTRQDTAGTNNGGRDGAAGAYPPLAAVHIDRANQQAVREAAVAGRGDQGLERHMVISFAAIQQDSSKSVPAGGGGLRGIL